MHKIILVAGMTVLFLSACATSDTLSDKRSGMLCKKTTERGEEVVDCLNRFSADPIDVRKRVVLYNASQTKKDQINCVHKQSLGSRFTRWECYYVNRPNANPTMDIGLLDLIDMGNRL